ncbi:hypothetical protein ACLB2K_038150 [Fragaria x ananassa]
MGACLSCIPKPEETQTNVRVVHLNGYVEEFEHPVSVGELTGRPPKHFVCTPTQLLSTGYKPLKQDTLLQQGQIYFLLPYSALQSDASPMDLAAVVRKLTALGRSGSKRSNEGLGRSGSWRSGQMSPMHCSSPVWSNYSSSPGRNSPGRFLEPEGSPSRMEMYGAQRSTRARSWKPLLDTISERQLNRRTESDLQEKHVEAAKYLKSTSSIDI